MFFKKLFILVPVLSLFALTGCKGSCESICDEAQDEECYKNDNSGFDHVGCIGLCTRQADMEDDDVDECSDEFDDLTSCISDQDDVCKAFEIDEDDYKLKKCNSEYEDYSKCLSEYCDDHEKRDYCGG